MIATQQIIVPSIEIFVADRLDIFIPIKAVIGEKAAIILRNGEFSLHFETLLRLFQRIDGDEIVPRTHFVFPAFLIGIVLPIAVHHEFVLVIAGTQVQLQSEQGLVGVLLLAHGLGLPRIERPGQLNRIGVGVNELEPNHLGFFLLRILVCTKNRPFCVLFTGKESGEAK